MVSDKLWKYMKVLLGKQNTNTKIRNTIGTNKKFSSRRRSKKCFSRLVDKRDSQTLVQVISHNVEAGTSVIKLSLICRVAKRL